MTKRKPRLAGRYVEILSILTKYGFGELARKANAYRRYEAVRRLLPERFRGELVEIPFAIRVRKALEELGPTFIKLGQLMANRHDPLPREIVRELETLQGDVAPFSSSQVVDLIESRFDARLETVFPEFELEPIAAAPIVGAWKSAFGPRPDSDFSERILPRGSAPGKYRRGRQGPSLFCRLRNDGFRPPESAGGSQFADPGNGATRPFNAYARGHSLDPRGATRGPREARRPHARLHGGVS